jgi:hypothetical protein
LRDNFFNLLFLLFFLARFEQAYSRIVDKAGFAAIRQHEQRKSPPVAGRAVNLVYKSGSD